MFHKNKLLAFSALSIFVLVGVAAIKPVVQKERNLTVLPKNISDEKLDSIMQTYNIALGVKCNFCHVSRRFMPDSIDFASDAEPMKENARKMMKMVIDINKTNFHYNKEVEPVYLNTVTCKTCHRGEPFPPEN